LVLPKQSESLYSQCTEYRLGNDTWGIDTVSIPDSISQVSQGSIRIDTESILLSKFRTFYYLSPFLFFIDCKLRIYKRLLWELISLI
jgi:hypothetical protein